VSTDAAYYAVKRSSVCEHPQAGLLGDLSITLCSVFSIHRGFIPPKAFGTQTHTRVDSEANRKAGSFPRTIRALARLMPKVITMEEMKGLLFRMDVVGRCEIFVDPIDAPSISVGDVFLFA
jgi:hypothetical protein